MIARKPSAIFFAVIKALFFRELGMRFSVSKTGLFWTFFEPFMQVFIMVIAKVVIFGRGQENFDYAVFLALNFTAYNLFKNIVTKSMGSFDANRGLFIYKQVKPIDTIIARTMVELYISGIIVLIFVGIGVYFDYDLHVKDLPMVAAGFLWMAVFAFSLGLVIAIGNTFFPSIGKTVSVSMLFIMFASAVFYPINILPAPVQAMLSYNPLAHFMEMLHGYYFYALDDRFVDYGYILLWTLGSLFVGLTVYRRFEERIISQ